MFLPQNDDYVSKVSKKKKTIITDETFKNEVIKLCAIVFIPS